MKAIKILTVIFLASFLITSCNQDEIPCGDERIFCNCVQEEAYDRLIPVIDNFLKDVKKNQSEKQKLDKLVDWLRCKSCVSKAEILCISCIETYPTQSEIKVGFIIHGEVQTKILDVIMDEPLRIRTFHD
jgi:hypothetical protein